ncbi:MAG: hypothetical protein ACFFDF_15635, partial [Candidatus Odinarchaeota archaeon]
MNNDGNSIKKTDEMRKYERITGRYAVWRGVITEGFRKWQRGEKIYQREKERISLYVSEDTKAKWLKYTKNNDDLTISKLIREAVSHFIENKSNETRYKLSKLNPQTIS